MQPEAASPGQGPSTILKAESDSPTIAPPPRSPRSARSVSEQPPESTEEPVASGTGPLPPGSPQLHGSSRESEMQRSSTPPDGDSIRYTRTGRVSKATKGQRVHQCEECGKVRRSSPCSHFTFSRHALRCTGGRACHESCARSLRSYVSGASPHQDTGMTKY